MCFAPRHPIGSTMAHLRCHTILSRLVVDASSHRHRRYPTLRRHSPRLPFRRRQLPSRHNDPLCDAKTIPVHLNTSPSQSVGQWPTVRCHSILARLLVDAGSHRRHNGPLCDATQSSLAFLSKPAPIGGTMAHFATPHNPRSPFFRSRLPSAAQWPNLRLHTPRSPFR